MNFKNDISKPARAWLILVAALAMACDNNIPTSESLAQDNTVSVADFTVDDAALDYGKSTILRWDVEVEAGATVDYISILPDIEKSTTALTGTKSITPKASTTYTLTAYIDNEAASSRSLKVTVTDPITGKEVTEEPEDEVCDDTTDNDLDGKTDCDDTDCAEAQACIITPITYDMTTSYALTTSTEDGKIYVGDSVTVSWTGNYQYVTITEFAGEYFGSSGSFTTTAAATNKFTLNGFDTDGKFTKSHTVEFAADVRTEAETPQFAAVTKTYVDPETVIYGQAYTFGWSVTDAKDVYLKIGDADFGKVEDKGTVEVDEATTSVTYQIYAVDENDLDNQSDPVTVTVTPEEFSDAKSSSMSEIKRLVYTHTSGEYYFINSSKIYYTADSGKSVKQVAAAGLSSGDLRRLATDNDGNVYVGTSTGLYYSTDKASTFKQIAAADGAKISAIYPRSLSSILVGTNGYFFNVYSSTEDDCAETGWGYMNGYCVQIHEFDGRETNNEFRDQPVNFENVYVKRDGNKMALIDTDLGTYITEDGGDSFHSYMSEISGAFWVSNREGYAWNKSDAIIYAYDRDTLLFTALGVQDSFYDIININAVAKIAGKLFVATDDAIYYNSDGVWNKSNIEFGSSDDAVKFFIASSVRDSGRAFASSGTNTLRGYTADGQVYTLEWTSTSSMANVDIGLTSSLPNVGAIAIPAGGF